MTEEEQQQARAAAKKAKKQRQKAKKHQSQGSTPVSSESQASEAETSDADMLQLFRCPITKVKLVATVLILMPDKPSWDVVLHGVILQSRSLLVAVAVILCVPLKSLVYML